MRLEPPRWWYAANPGPWPWLLSPAAAAYHGMAWYRFFKTRPYTPSIPVICVGNFTTGGAGKTPLALAIGKQLIVDGLRPAFLTRGYGGSARGPYDVDPDRDSAERVGDEPLLLARIAPTVVSADRAIGARHIERGQADVIIMDDGLQNPSVQKTLSLAVVDGQRGLGNGWTMPAGPARASLPFQVQLADAIVINGSISGNGDPSRHVPDGFEGPVLHAALRTTSNAVSLDGTAIVAFSGIGNPDRFFQTVKNCGGRLVAHYAFGDHHRFSEIDAGRILGDADAHDAMIVTTEKDWVRIPAGDNVIGTLRARSYALPVELAFIRQDGGRLKFLVDMAVRNVQSVLRSET